MKFVVRKHDFFLRETAGGHWVVTRKAARASRFSCHTTAVGVASGYPDAVVEPLRPSPKEAVS